MNVSQILRSLCILALAACGGASLGFAHDPGLSTAEGRVDAHGLTLVISLAGADARQVLGPATPGEPSFPLAADRRWSEIAAAWCDARIGGTELKPAATAVAAAANDGVSFHLAFVVPPGAVVDFRLSQLARLPPHHREFVLITDAADHPLVQKFLSAEDPRVELRLPSGSLESPASPAAPPAFLAFFQLGVEHIWTGYDHLLFLFGLLIVCRRFRSIATIVSCFTIAHSVTLAVATLHILVLPSRWVEPAIAASIVFVGIENIVRGGAEPRGRFVLTFAFGLIHGFGFASALSDLGVGRGAGSVVGPLLSFNLGVEFGQIAIAAIALPIVWRLRRGASFVRFGVPALSSVVAAAGLYWFVARTVLA